LRSAVRVSQGKFKAAESDATIAIDKGLDDALVYDVRRISREQLGDRAGAEADAAAARQRSQADGSG
jgi:hypothetical protein